MLLKGKLYAFLLSSDFVSSLFSQFRPFPPFPPFPSFPPLPHTVVSELYQERLVTEDEVKRMKGKGWDLLYQLISVQCTKSSDVVTRTAHIMAKFGHNDEAKQLRGW